MSAAIESLLALRESLAGDLREGEAGWIGRLREEAREHFVAQGLPGRSVEAWKGTNLAPLERIAFERVAAGEARPVVVTGDGAPELHFVDGRLDTASTQAAHLPNGVRLLSLAEARRQAPELLEGRLGGLASAKQHPLVALQTAFLDDGAVLAVDAGVEIESPIRVRFSSTPGSPSACFPRLLVLAGERSRAVLVVEHTSQASDADLPAAGLSAFVAELYLAAGARVEVAEIQDEVHDRIHFTSTHARLEADASLDAHVFTLGRGLVRSELEIALAEPGSEARMRGFFLGGGDAHVDHFTTVDHAAERCTSDQEYRGVLGDRAHGVFRGRVIVRPDAQQTDARQSNPNLILSDHASVDSKPQLEIYADDVRASHGSTIGQLDPDALFFLRARGIDLEEARLLLTRGFAHGIVDAIGNDELRTEIRARVDEALASVGQTSGKRSGASSNAAPGGEDA